MLVARKWVDRRPVVDPLTGAVATDPRTSGASDADDAALEWALRMADTWGCRVVAATVGPLGADAVLREALAAGADQAVRVDAPGDLPSTQVAAALHDVARHVGATMVVCGNASLDRGSGAVPAFVADALAAAQALGLVDLRLDRQHPGELDAWRRLDGGRRERLRLQAPFVVSVEGSTARLRRAPLPRALHAASATTRDLQVHPWRPVPRSRAVPSLEPVGHGPYRPRAKVVPGPDPSLPPRQRILALIGALAERTPPRTVVLEPGDAADLVLTTLQAWGELP